MISLQFSPVQTFITKRVANYLSKELDSKITFDKIYLKPFTSLELVNFNWKDKNDKTILSASSLESSFILHRIIDNELVINKIEIKDSYLNIEIYKDSTNFSNAINYFSSEKKQKTSKEKMKLKLDIIEIKNNHLKLTDYTKKHNNQGIDYSNLDIQDFFVRIDDIKIDSVLKASITNLRLKETSGLIIKKLETKFSLAPNYMEFDALYLSTNKSILQNYLKFEYNSLADFSNFIKKVKINANIRSSKISSQDIEFFAPSINKVQFDTEVNSAKINGTITNINVKKVNLRTAKNTNIQGEINIQGLPNIHKTIFDFNLSSLKTSALDIETIVSKLTGGTQFKLPNELDELGTVDYQGSIKGLYNDFGITGDFITNIGKFNTKTKININESLSYRGNILSNDFLIGKLIKNNTVQKTGFNLNFEGSELSLEKLNLKFDGSLHQTAFQKYTLDKTNLSGQILDKSINLDANIEDNNLKLNLAAVGNWQNQEPSYKLNTQINYADLNKLNLFKNDSIIINNAIISTNLTGSTLNTLKGNLIATPIKISTTKGDFEIKNFDFNASGNEADRELSLRSDILDITILGKIDLTTIAPYFRSLAMRYAPAIALKTTAYNAQNFNLELKIKSFKPLASLIDQSLSLGDGTYLKADFSSDNYLASFNAFSPMVNYKGMKLTNLDIREEANKEAFSLKILADRLNFSDSTYINKIAINNILANDSLKFNIEMSKKDAVNYLDLNGNIHFSQNSPAYIKFEPSIININNERWNLNKEAELRVSKGKIYINNLLVNHNLQQIKLTGVISDEDEDLHINFNNFNLTSLNGITKPLGIQLKGDLDGIVTITSVLKNPYASTNIKTSPILYNDIAIGQLSLDANFKPKLNQLFLDINLHDKLQRGISLIGKYDVANKTEPLNLFGKINSIDLNIFQPFLSNLVSKLEGRADADIRILGTLNNPKISGNAKVINTQFIVNYLKTNYKIDNQLASAENNAIYLRNFILKDAKGNQITANGLIDLSKLDLPFIDINTSTKNALILNTTLKDNNIYYGTAYATGDFNFQGYTNALNIDINAKSESGTTINLPFNSAMKVSDNDFIYFVNKDTTEKTNKERKNIFNGLTMNMDLNLTTDAELNLQTNLGNLKGNGNGSIIMKISSLGDFEMFGDYIVNNGKFHFTAQDFINKYFDIKQGGSIRWTGKPGEANVNLNAIYQQRTSVGPLYNAAGREGEDERVLAQADMLMKGTLEQPDITFDLNFPQNPYIKDQLQSFLSDANNVNQQALSLIVRRSFTPSTTEQIGKEVNNTLLSAGTEIAFNQLNNIISESLNLNFFDLNIRSFNDASASVRLWNDRLVLTGGIADRSNYQATDFSFFKEGIMTDAELSLKLRQDGNLTLRAYNRPYTRNFLLRANDADNISALGVVYRQEFNTINEFWKKLWKWKEVKKEDKSKAKR